MPSNTIYRQTKVKKSNIYGVCMTGSEQNVGNVVEIIPLLQRFNLKKRYVVLRGL